MESMQTVVGGLRMALETVSDSPKCKCGLNRKIASGTISPPNTLMACLMALLVLPVVLPQESTPAGQDAKVESVWRVQELMVPVRDGVHLQTVVITRKGETRNLPILM